MTWQLAFSIVETVWVVGASCFILLDKRSPTATLAWILGMAMLPLVGGFIYRFLGPRRLARKQHRRLRARADVHAGVEAFLERAPLPEHRRAAQLMRLATHKTGMEPATVRALELYTDGAATFAAIREAIDAAKHHVHVEYYIFEPDVTGSAFLEALVRAARRGVEVRLLVDALGSPRLKKRVVAPLVAAGGQFARFNPARLGKIWRHSVVNFRSHRKIVVVDGQIGFTGGINVHDDENREVKKDEAWRDTHIRLDGAVVRGLQRTFLEDWHFATRSAPLLAAYFPDVPQGQLVGQIVASGPDNDALAVAKVYFAAIACARDRVWLSTPYFVPNEAFMAALITAAGRGVDVRLLLSRRTDSRWVDAAGRSFHEELLRAGVKIYLYGPNMLHAKTLLVDHDMATVGTANFDDRSLRLNFEVIALLYGADLNAQLAEVFLADLERAPEARERDARIPLRQRLFEALARILSPQL